MGRALWHSPSLRRELPTSGLGVWGLVFGVWYLVFGIWGLGFGVWGLGCRAAGVRFRV